MIDSMEANSTRKGNRLCWRWSEGVAILNRVAGRFHWECYLWAEMWRGPALRGNRKCKCPDTRCSGGWGATERPLGLNRDRKEQRKERMSEKWRRTTWQKPWLSLWVKWEETGRFRRFGWVEDFCCWNHLFKKIHFNEWPRKRKRWRVKVEEMCRRLVRRDLLLRPCGAWMKWRSWGWLRISFGLND